MDMPAGWLDVLNVKGDDGTALVLRDSIKTRFGRGAQSRGGA